MEKEMTGADRRKEILSMIRDTDTPVSGIHDIGKIAIPDTILNKPSKLSEEEFSIIKEHTIIGANILKNISLIDHVQEIVRNHHEHDPYTKSQRKSRLFNWASKQK